LDVVKRAVHLWTNPGDIVFSPFAGVGSELHGAIELGRKAVGIELKRSYFDIAAGYLAELESKIDAPRLDFGGGEMESNMPSPKGRRRAAV
jgi:DNA modification methylase